MKLSSLVFLLALTGSAMAERTYPAWTHKHNPVVNNLTQHPVDVAVTSAGHVAVTTYNDDLYDSWYTSLQDAFTGQTIWQMSFGVSNYDCRPVALVVDSEDNVIVTGIANSTTMADIYTIKYSKTGSVVWQRRYNYTVQNGGDEPVALAVDASNNVYVTGKSQFNGKDDIVLIKYQPLGQEDWSRRYTTSYNDRPADLAVLNDGRVVIAGSSQVSVNAKLCYVTVCFKPDGVQDWVRTYDSAEGDDDEATDVAVSPTQIAVTGKLRRPGSGYLYGTIVYDYSGGEDWKSLDSEPTNDGLNAPRVDFTLGGDVVFCGTIRLDGKKTVLAAMQRRSSDGYAQWNGTSLPANTPADAFVTHRLVDMATDLSGNIYALADTYSTETGNDLLTVKFSLQSKGVAWTQQVNGDAAAGIDTPVAIAVDATCNVAVTGMTDKGDQNIHYQTTTVRYNSMAMVPGDRVEGSGLSNAAKISAFNPPSVRSAYSFMTKATIKDGSKSLTGIVQHSDYGHRALALQGLPAPGTNGKFATFNDPTGSANYAFVATLSGVPATENKAVFMSVSNNPMMLLQTGKPVPGTGGLLLANVFNLDVMFDMVIARVQLKGTGVTTANNQAVVAVKNSSTGILLARTGMVRTIDGKDSKVTSLGIFSPPPNSAGHGRNVSFARTVLRLGMSTGHSVFASADHTNGALNFLAVTNGDASTAVAGAKWNTITAPGVSVGNSPFSALATLKTGIAGVTTANDSVAIWNTTANTSFKTLFREGTSAFGIPGATFVTLTPPISNNGYLSIVATVKGAGITTANNTGLWLSNGTTHSLLVRTGDIAPDAGTNMTTRKIAAIKTHVLPNDGLPLFTATLTGPGVTTANNSALFAVDSGNDLRQMIRTGDVHGTLKVKAFSVFQSAATVMNSSRSYESTGTVLVRVTYTNLTQAILRLKIP